MGKTVKKIGKKIGGSLVGGLIGGPIGSIGGLIGGGLGGGEKAVETGSTILNPSGQEQFDFANQRLTGLLGGGAIQAGGGDFGAALNALNSVNFGGINNSIGRLENFKGSSEAFRSLDALSNFGQGEQGFVTDARNAVLNFDEGFESNALPLLQQAAEGRFLTEQAGNPFVRDLIDTAQRPVIENFNEQVLPGVLSTFAGTGGVGSSLRAGFTGQQARDLQRNLGDISTNIGFNVFENERGRQLAAQQAILGFEDAGLGRQLSARTANLGAAQTTASQLLQALQGAASGQVALSGQQQAALAAALQGQIGSGQLQISRGQGLAGIAGQQQQLNIANAQLQQQQINQLLQFQQNAGVAGTTQTQNLVKPGLI